MAERPRTLSTSFVASITGTTTAEGTLAAIVAAAAGAAGAGGLWPHLVDATGNPLLQDTGVWGVEGVDLGANCVRDGRTYFFFGDIATKSAAGVAPFEGPDLVAWTDDKAVWRKGGHQALGLSFVLPIEPHASEGQPGWRYCTECQALFWSLAPGNRCAATKDGYHNAAGLYFRIPFESTGIPGQTGWRRCVQCAELVYFGEGAQTVPGCPVNGFHKWDPANPAHVLPTIAEGSPPPQDGQPYWRYCVRCACLFFNGQAEKGICARAPGGGLRLHAVLQGGRVFYDPFTATDPVGALFLNELPIAAFAWEDRIYVVAGFTKTRPGDPAAGQYLCSKVHPEIPGEYHTEFMLGPKLGWCGVDLQTGEQTPALYNHDPRGFTFMLQRAADNSPPRERGWRICKKCGTLFDSALGLDIGACQASGHHEKSGDLEFVVGRDLPENHEHQSNWRRCTKCFAMFWVDPGRPPDDTGRCPGGGVHAATAGINLIPRHTWREEDGQNQRWWRFCVRCHALFFDRYIGKGKGACPASTEGHFALGLEFVLPHGMGEGPTQQWNWRFCEKCFAIFYDGELDKGRCAGNSGGFHSIEPSSHVFSLPHDLPPSGDRQSNWRYCVKCRCLCFAGSSAAPCAAGGIHDLTLGFNFHLPCHPGLDPDRSFRYCRRCRCMVRHDHWIDRITGHRLEPAQQVDWAAQQDDWANWLATCVITNQDHAQDLTGALHPGSPAQGLVMLGYEGHHFRLAWMPLAPGRKPRFDTIRYYHRGKNTWTKEPDLTPGSELFVNENRPWRWSHVSAMWIKEARCWIVVYQKAADGDPHSPIVARIGWSLRRWSREFVLFDPKVAHGKYLHVNGVHDEFHGKLPPTLEGDIHNGFAYGAFILENYTNWEAAQRILKLHYLLSTFMPYQVHVMYSEVYIPPLHPSASTLSAHDVNDEQP